MSDKSFHLDIVSVEERLFKGRAQALFVTGVMGELEVLAGHAPLLTALDPGPVWITKDDGSEEAFVIHGGMLEIQPNITTILADSALRVKDMDEAAALEAKQRLEREHTQQKSDFDYAKAHKELLSAVAQLRVLKNLRKQLK